jgi:hypothetical protein
MTGDLEGKVFKFIGEEKFTEPAPAVEGQPQAEPEAIPVDLTAADFTDATEWEEVKETTKSSRTLKDLGFAATVSSGKKAGTYSVNFSGPLDQSVVENFEIEGTGGDLPDAEEPAKGGAAVGALIIRNDVRSSAIAKIDTATIIAGSVNVAVLEAARIHALLAGKAEANGDGEAQSIAAGGIIATNLILNEALALITNATITTTDDTSVTAENRADILARNNSSISSDGTGVNVTLAFNTIGYEATGIWNNIADALVGTDLGTEDRAEAVARIDGSTIDAGGNVTVSAVSHAQILSQITNDTESELGDDAGDDASAVAAGIIIASNMTSSAAIAEIVDSNTLGGRATSVITGGDLSVTSEDKGTILSNVNLSAKTGGDGEMAQAIQAFVDFFKVTYSDYSGTKSITLGDRVRIGHSGLSVLDRPDTISSGDRIRLDWDICGGTAGTVYEYIGEEALEAPMLDQQDYSDTLLWREILGDPDKLYIAKNARADVDLATEDYTNSENWLEVDVDPLVKAAKIAANAIEGSSAKGTGFGGLFARNDLRTSVQANLSDVTVEAAGGVTVDAQHSALVIANDESVVSADTNAINVVIANNTILGGNTALVDRAIITAVGDMSVAANTDASILANVKSEVQASTSVGIVLAFNTIGYAPADLFHATIDALAGNSDAGNSYVASKRHQRFRAGRGWQPECDLRLGRIGHRCYRKRRTGAEGQHRL